MRAKTEIVVKLVSPGQACEGCEVHGAESNAGTLYDARQDLNNPPTAVGGISRFWSPILCRLDLNNPPTSVGGISELDREQSSSHSVPFSIGREPY